MTRRRFSERDVIATLLYQGADIRCHRTGAPITAGNLHLVEREHLHELALGGSDEPMNCRYSLKEAHAAVTNGTPATSLGSSKHKIAKAKRISKGKMDLDRMPLRSVAAREKLDRLRAAKLAKRKLFKKIGR